MKKCFVISPIGEEGSQVREHADTVFQYIIKPATRNLGIKIYRADHMLEPGRISDQMFHEIFSSDLCIAILTGHNPNVFYELALAQMARRPVIVLIAKHEKIPFDVQDLRCIFYELSPRRDILDNYINQLKSNLKYFKYCNYSVRSPFDSFLRRTGLDSFDQDQAIQEDESNYSVTFGNLTIRIIIGRIEKLKCNDKCLIALPANEFFDDECINDSQSSLGAYMQYHFQGRISEIQSIVKSKLCGLSYSEVEKEDKIFAASYGIGTKIYLDHPLGSDVRIALVAVTTKRSGEGLKATLKSIYKSLQSIYRIMVDYKLNILYIPTLGSGHGALTKEFSLFSIMMSLGELFCARPNMKVNIVVYQKDESSKPEISPENIKYALSMYKKLFTSV